LASPFLCSALLEDGAQGQCSPLNTLRNFTLKSILTRENYALAGKLSFKMDPFAVSHRPARKTHFVDRERSYCGSLSIRYGPSAGEAALGPTPDSGERRAHAAIVAAIYLAEVDMQFDNTLAARAHRKKEAVSSKKYTAKRLPVGKDVFITRAGNPFANFGGKVERVTRNGRRVETLR
jgi:hypothetical protein